MKCFECLLGVLFVTHAVTVALTPPRPTCYIEDGFDFPGNDIGSILSNTSANCCSECAKLSACRAWSWNNYQGGTCWFKSKRDTVLLKDGVQSALRFDSPRDGCQIQLNADYEDHDLTRVDGSSVQACCGACKAYHGCRAYSWSNYLGGSCFLKSDRGRVLYKEGVQSGQVWPTPYGDTVCPLRLSVDFVGNDIGSAGSGAPEGCCGICSKTTNCYAYTWTDYHGGTCWLKSFRGNVVAKPGAVSAQLYENPVRTCDVEADVDYQGGDLGSEPSYGADACCGMCSQHQGCKAYTWSSYNSGTCWLKGGNYTRVESKGMVSGKTRAD